MIIGNAKLFLDGAFQEGSLTFENGVITAVGPAQGPCDLDAGGKYLVPGFLDVHTHGAMNEDFSDGRPEGLPIMSRHYAAHGVTSFLATTMTLKEETLTPAMHAIRDFRRPADGAKCAGIHLEGPFLCYAKRGAQAAENLHEPDASMFHRLNEASGGMVRLITVAPEDTPTKNPTSRLIMVPVVPTAARAWVPTYWPTTMVSTVLYSCWKKVPIKMGKKKIKSCFQITPVVMLFSLMVWVCSTKIPPRFDYSSRAKPFRWERAWIRKK